MSRICLFGGTFDPIHTAHLRIAVEAVKLCRLDRVLFIPAGHPPHKDAGTVTPFADRFHMVEAACAPYPEFEASRLEEPPASSYSIDTVERLLPTITPADRLYFLIGSDAFNDIQTWKRWTELLRLVTFIVAARPGSSLRVPEGAQIERLSSVELFVSSSETRRRLQAAEPTPELPDAVAAYIERRNLYR